MKTLSAQSSREIGTSAQVHTAWIRGKTPLRTACTQFYCGSNSPWSKACVRNQNTKQNFQAEAMD